MTTLLGGRPQVVLGLDDRASTEILEGMQAQDEGRSAPPTRLQPWAWYDGECLCDVVYDHARIPDGHRIITSPVLFIDEAVGIARTMNRSASFATVRPQYGFSSKHTHS